MAERQHPDERDVDAIFESIVARWEDEAPDPQGGSRAGDAAEPDEDPGQRDMGEPDEDPGQQEAAEPPPEDDDEGGPPPARRSATNPPWRVPSTDTDAETGATPSPFAHADSVPWRVDPTHSVADLLGQQDHPGDADDDEGFTPPPTRPLPPFSDRLFWGALVGLVLGPLGLVWMLLLHPGAGFLTKTVVFGLTIGGFACLVLRQPTDRGDDPDDGARV